MVLSANAILERVKDVARSRSETELGAALGTSASAVGNWRRRNTIPIERLWIFSKAHRVSLDWLLSGEGDKALRDAQGDIHPELLGTIADVLLSTLSARGLEVRETAHPTHLGPVELGQYLGLIYRRVSSIGGWAEVRAAAETEAEYLLEVRDARLRTEKPTTKRPDSVQLSIDVQRGRKRGSK